MTDPKGKNNQNEYLTQIDSSRSSQLREDVLHWCKREERKGKEKKHKK